MKRLFRSSITFAVLTLLAVNLAARADSITNNFDNNLDYLMDGVTGSMWDGVYLGYGDIYNGTRGRREWLYRAGQ